MECSRNHLLSASGVFLCLLFAGTAPASLTEFIFDDIEDLSLSQYMTGIYGFDVTVEYAAVYPSDTLDPLSALGSDKYIADAVPGSHQFTIEFAVPITALYFDWARTKDPFQLDVVYADGTTAQLFSMQGEDSTSGIWGIDALPKPVSTLFFHDGGKGAIGIDNLQVNAVPLATSILLGAFAVGLAGWQLRRFV